jgi:undecaprenyl diphosphate synthase
VAVDRITEAAARARVRWLTLYAFSTENWQRPRREVSLLWRLLVRDLKRRASKCLREGIRLTSIGRRDRIPPIALRELERVEEVTAHCERMTLCLALDYGGMWDLTQFGERIRELDRAGALGDAPLDPSRLAELLPSGKVPPVDLLLRTGGDQRISNFLPVQLTYAELMFEDKLWPDYDEADLLAAFDRFAGKDRRFGRIEEKVQS